MNDMSGPAPSEERPLYSIEAEQAVLGSLLLSAGDAWDRIVGIVGESDFKLDSHRYIFRAISALIHSQQPPDILTVADWATSQGVLDRMEGLAYLQELLAVTPSVANVRRYAEIVREKATLRRLLETCGRVATRVREPSDQSSDAILNWAQETLSSIAMIRSQGRGELRHIAPFATQAMVQIDEAAKQREHKGVTGFPTGLSDLDDKTGGLKEGQLIVLGGRPAMGKTALALGIAVKAAITHNLATGVFSMEMQGHELATRIIADLSNIHGLRLSHGRNISTDEWGTIGKANAKVQSLPIYVCEDGGLSFSELAAAARRFRRSVPNAGLIVIDYFGLMRLERETSNLAQDLGRISRDLKALAKELRLPVLLLAQVNREVEKRSNKRPVSSDLRDSGSLEQDADMILFVYRDHVYNPTAREDDAEIIIAKQRNGPIGTVYARYDAPRTRFHDGSEP